MPFLVALVFLHLICHRFHIKDELAKETNRKKTTTLVPEISSNTVKKSNKQSKTASLA